MFDFCCLLLIGLMALSGWRKGLLMMALSLVGLATSYGLAFLLYKPVGQVVGRLFSLQPLVSYPLGGMVVFSLSMLGFGLVGRALIRRRRRTKGLDPAWRRADLVAGAILGASYGTAISLLVIWAMLVLQSFAPNAGLHVRGSMAARLATPLVSSFAHWAAHRASNSDRVATAARQFVKDPVEASKDLTAVVNHRRVQSLLKDPKTVHALAHDEQRVINSPTLRALARDKTFVEQATRLGLLDEGSDQDVPRRIAQGLAPLARVIHTLAHDREVQSLLKDPQLAQKLKDKDMLSLANDEKFNRLAEILLQRLGQSSTEKKAEMDEQG